MMNAVAVDREAASSETIEVGFSGYVHGVALVDLLQIFHYSRRSLTLHVEPNAAIYVSGGEIIHARVGDIEGELAISTLLARTSGRIRTTSPEVAPTTIHRPFNFLLLDALRDMDEAHRDEAASVWPEETGAFATEVLAVPRASRFPSVPAAGNELLVTACLQLAERVEETSVVAVVDLNERKLVAHYGTVNKQLLEAQCLAAFGRSASTEFEALLHGEGAPPVKPFDEIRFIGQSGLFFGKMLGTRPLGVVLCTRSSEAPGLAWAELRQSVLMMERIMP